MQKGAPTIMLKLNLRQNALHTLLHSVEHLYWSEQERSQCDDRSFGHDTHAVEWRDKDGRLCFIVPELGFTRPPAVYNLKFALLHLIQSAELLLKSYVEQCEPEALFTRPGSRKTIGLREALRFTVERNPTLLAPAEIALLLEAKDFRNAMEHYQFDFVESRFRELCATFLALSMLLAQELLSINLVEAFSWDYLHDRPDPVIDYLSRVLGEASESGRLAVRKAGESWVAHNPSYSVFICLYCGARALSSDRGLCMACGTEGDENIAILLEEFEATERRLAELTGTHPEILEPQAP